MNVYYRDANNVNQVLNTVRLTPWSSLPVSNPSREITIGTNKATVVFSFNYFQIHKSAQRWALGKSKVHFYPLVFNVTTENLPFSLSRPMQLVQFAAPCASNLDFGNYIPPSGATSLTVFFAWMSLFWWVFM
jgi:hypothetical protein